AAAHIRLGRSALAPEGFCRDAGQSWDRLGIEVAVDVPCRRMPWPGYVFATAGTRVTDSEELSHRTTKHTKYTKVSELHLLGKSSRRSGMITIRCQSRI